MRAWLNTTKVGPSARMVFLVLGLFDRDGEAWPSVTTIVDLSALSRRTVQRALRELEVGGDVVAQERAGHSTRYQLCPHGGVTVTHQGASPRRRGGVIDDQKGRHGDAQKELKELKKESGTAAALSTRASGGTANNGALTEDGATFLPGTGWVYDRR